MLRTWKNKDSFHFHSWLWLENGAWCLKILIGKRTKWSQKTAVPRGLHFEPNPIVWDWLVPLFPKTSRISNHSKKSAENPSTRPHFTTIVSPPQKTLGKRYQTSKNSQVTKKKPQKIPQKNTQNPKPPKHPMDQMDPKNTQKPSKKTQKTPTNGPNGPMRPWCPMTLS